jgi:hypothetical protein
MNYSNIGGGSFYKLLYHPTHHPISPPKKVEDHPKTSPELLNWTRGGGPTA